MRYIILPEGVREIATDVLKAALGGGVGPDGGGVGCPPQAYQLWTETIKQTEKG